ncbi:ribonuclease H-like domain-containing protein [Tanacetum coccineum]
MKSTSDTGVAPKQQQKVIPQTTVILNIKLPILKKEEYDIWAMEMEHYLEYIDNEVWKVIQNGNSKKRISTGKDGIVRILSPVTAAEIQAVEKERKAKNILLMAIPKEHMRSLEAHGAEVSTEDANHKFLRSLPAAWSNLAMTMRTKPEVDTLSIDDLYNNLRVFEQEIQGASKTSSSAQNVAFVSQSKSSTNKVKSGFTGAYSTCTPSTSSTNIPEKEVLAGFADEVIYSLFAKQSEDWDLLHEDLEQIDDVDIEEMDINWQIAMIAIRMKKFYKKTGRRVRVDGKTPVGFDKKKLECFNCHNTGHFARECTAKGTHDGKKKRDSFYQHQEAGKQEKNQMGLLTMDDGIVNWGEHTEVEETNHALMAISSSNEVTLCSKTCIDSYNTLKTLCDEQMNQLGDQEAQILAYSQAVKKLEAQLVTFQKQQLSLNEKLTFQANEIYEKDEKLKRYRRIGMKAVKEKEQLQKTLDSWKDSSKNLWRLINSGMSSNSKVGLGFEIQSNNEVLSYEDKINFSVFNCSKEDSVGKPLYSRFTKTNDFKGVPHPLSGDYTPTPQEEIDESLYVYGKKGPQEPEPNVSDDRSSEYSTCQSNDSAGSIGTSSEHSVDPESEILSVPPEVYVSTPITSNEKGVSDPKSKEVEPSCVSHIKTPRQPIKDQATPNVNRKNWNAMMERELGEDRLRLRNKGFLILANINSVRPNINTGRVNVNSVRSNVNTGRINVNPVRPRVNTGSSNVNSVRSSQPVPTKTSNSFSPKRPQGNWGSAVKTSPNYNWRNSRPNFNYNSGPTFIRNEHPLKNMVDRGIFDSGCSGHMTGNKDQLEDFEEFNRGSVIFGGSKGYISGKGRIRVGQEHPDVAQTQPSSSTIPVPSTSTPPVQSPPPTTASIPGSTPPPIPETEPEPIEHTFEEPSPAHQHFSPPQEHAQGQMTVDDLLQVVPQLMSRIDSLEKDLKQTKLTMGSAIVKLVKKVKKLEGILKRRNVVLSDSEEEEPEAQGRKSQDDPLVSLVQGLVTPSKTTVNASGEEQVEDISPTTLEAAKTLSRVASQKPKSIDKGRRYKRRKETKGKKVVSSLVFQEEVDTGAKKVNTAKGVNTDSIKISTVSEQVSTGSAKRSIPSPDKGQRARKAPMIIEETPKKSKEQILQEEASLAEAIRLDTLQKEEVAKQHYTDEDWDLFREKIEANAELSKSMLGSDLQGEDFAKKMVELNQGTWKLSQLKNLSFVEVKEEFDKLVKQVKSFAPINFEATKDSLKRFGEELQTKTSKRLKSDESKDDESTKKTGKRKKQIARKGLHSK